MSNLSLQTSAYQDLRQTAEWANYLKLIGWNPHVLDGIQVYIRSLPFTSYSLVKVQRPIASVPFAKIDDLAKSSRALFTIIEPYNTCCNTHEFSRFGYVETPLMLTYTATSRLDIQRPIKEVVAGFSSNARRNIKKGERNNLRVEVVRPQSYNATRWGLAFYQLMKETAASKGFYCVSLTETAKKIQALQEISVLLFAYHNDDNEPISAIWLAYSQKIAYYLHAASTYRGYAASANYLLVSEGIRYLQSLGVEVFDFDSIYDYRFPNVNSSWKGFSEFKRKFKGQEILFPMPQIKFYNKALGLLHKYTILPC